MKKVVLTAVAVIGLAASTFAQGTVAMDNLNGAGNNHATSFGLFFGTDGVTLYTAPTINLQLLGGANAGSLAPLGSAIGAGGMVSLGGGIYADPQGGEYPVAGVAGGANATLQVLAWVGASGTYAGAAGAGQFWAWNGTALQDAATFTFANPTGGPTTPPSPPRSLDGMPAMTLVVPEPSTFALLGLGLLGLFIRRK